VFFQEKGQWLLAIFALPTFVVSANPAWFLADLFSPFYFATAQKLCCIGVYKEGEILRCGNSNNSKPKVHLGLLPKKIASKRYPSIPLVS
jgi:hypothetical protein